MTTLFLLLRYLTGLTLASALLVLGAIVFLHSTVALAKEGVGAVGYVASLFTSGFTKGTAPESRGWVVALPQVALAGLFIAMIVSLFLPDARALLHIVAAFGMLALIWYTRMIFTGPQLEVVCVPLFLPWFAYYAACIFWRTRLLSA